MANLVGVSSRVPKLGGVIPDKDIYLVVGSFHGQGVYGRQLTDVFFLSKITKHI